MQNFSFSVCIISLNKHGLSPRFIHVSQVTRCPTFSRLHNIPVCIDTTFSSSIHSLVGTEVVALSWLYWTVLRRTWECRSLFEILTSTPLAVYPAVGLLDYMVVLLLFWGTSTLVSIVITQSYIPINNVQGFPFLYSLAITYLLSFWS